MAKASKSKTGFSGIFSKLSLFLGALLVVATGAGLTIGHDWMVQRVARERALPVKLVIDWPLLSASSTAPGNTTTWMRDQDQRPITALTMLALSDDPYDLNALERASEAILSTGWAKRIISIQRRPGGVVHVSADWRTPAAVVRHGDLDYLVSADGDLLPPTFSAGQSGLRVIMNPAFAPPTNPGEKWIGGDVQAGLALLGQLQTDRNVYRQVIGIDVERYTRARKLAAVTDKGNLVVWGVPPGESRVGETSTQRKMALLQTLLADPAYGRRIDANQPLVDLTSPRGILIDASARPLFIPNSSPATEAEESRQKRSGDSIAIGQQRDED